MSDLNNPYKSPAANSEPVAPLVSQGVLTETMVKHLSAASPWLRFMGIMGYIAAGVCILFGVFSLAALEYNSDGVWFFYAIFGQFALINPVLYALYFIGAGVIAFFPALFTYRFGAKIRSFTQTNSAAELELAFRNNKSLWKFQGILTIIALVMIPLLIIISILVTVATLSAF